MADDKLLPFDPSMKKENKKKKAPLALDALEAVDGEPSASEPDTDFGGMKTKNSFDVKEMKKSITDLDDAKEKEAIPLEAEENIVTSENDRDELAGKEDSQGAASKKIEVHLLLAETYKKGEMDPTGWWMSEKLDGVRAFWNGENLYSRLGNCFDVPSWFKKDLPSDMHFDGELFMGRNKFQKTSSIVKTLNGQNWNQLKFHVFDIPSMEDEPFENRMAAIDKYVDKNKPTYIVCVEQTKCESCDHLEKELKKVLDKGGEGLMLREPKSKYERTRSRTLLKVKNPYTAEARVVAHKLGKGKFSGKLGSLKCEMESGKHFCISAGLTKENRENPPNIGSIISYKFYGYTDAKIPKSAVFIGESIDQSEPNDADVITEASDD